jgi:hypothetical protein
MSSIECIAASIAPPKEQCERAKMILQDALDKINHELGVEIFFNDLRTIKLSSTISNLMYVKTNPGLHAAIEKADKFYDDTESSY